MKVKIHNKECYIDGYLNSNLTLAKKVIKKDLDLVFVVDGFEGSGKSTLAQMCACFLDPTFNIKRICFTAKQFKEAIEEAKPYQAVIFDEAYRSLSSRGALSEVNKALISMMTQIRYKNLFVFIIIPCFFELDKYISVWRSRALLNCRFGTNFQRGYFYFYSVSRKKDLYIKGKKFYEYKVPPTFKGRFTKFSPINQNKYKEKKMKSLSEKSELSKYQEDCRIQRNNLIVWCKNEGKTCEEIGNKIELGSSAIRSIIKRGNYDEGKRHN